MNESTRLGDEAERLENEMARLDSMAMIEGEAIRELSSLRKQWWCLMILGIVLITCGIGAISYPFFATVGVAITIAIFMLIGGIMTIIASFWANRWGAFLVQLITGIFYTVVGIMMAEVPGATMTALTLLVAAFAIAGGTVRIVAALSLQFPQWGWVLFNGLIVLIFGVIIFRHFGEANLVLLGIMLGVDLLCAGFTWLFLSLEIRSLPAIK